ncbi:MAG: DUF5615 family PIN-like protein [Acetobacteraceae bacterium]|nr:DUF5615 family PIN-like protein [Acetobacteraceae bacterium]
MARALLDHNVPRRLARLLTGHEVRTAADEGWAELSNGELLAIAEARGFDVLVTADQRIRDQQNLSGRRLAIVVLSNPAWPVVREHIPTIAEAVNRARVGSFELVRLARPSR